jgi:hypothetical protein
LWLSTEHQNWYEPLCSVTVKSADWPGEIVDDPLVATPGPLTVRLCRLWEIVPWLLTWNVYVPGTMAAFGMVIENSFSTTLTTLPTARASVWVAADDVLPPPLEPPQTAKADAKTAMTDTR